jgi:hypothetical protein
MANPPPYAGARWQVLFLRQMNGMSGMKEMVLQPGLGERPRD